MSTLDMTAITKRFPERAFTGMTTADYVEAAVIYGGYGALFQISNTGGTYTLYYKVSLYLSDSASAVEQVIVSETNLGTSTASALNSSINYPFYKAVISVKNHSGATTYLIEANAYY